ncbi:AmmeMemoRadiSam system radical SAM enzyme [Nitrospira sp. Kam-Ns4a]
MRRKALFYEEDRDLGVRCTLCPLYCRIAPGHRGACGVRVNEAGVLYTLVADRVVSQEVDPIEKKPLFHVLPGSTAYSIATVGCNLRCSFCQNWQLSQRPKGSAAEPDDRVPGVRVTPAAVVHRALARGCLSVAYTYTEPTVFFELALDTAILARQAGLRNVFVTNGFTAPAAIRMIAPYLAAANIDLKSFRESFYKRVCGARLAPVLDAIRLYKALGVWIELTTLVIPGLNDSDAELRELADFIATDLGPEVPWHVSRFFPAFRLSDGAETPIDTLRRAALIGREAGLQYVYLGNVPEEEGGEDTRCPECGTVVLRRTGLSLVDNRLKSGACPACRQAIPGIWT